MTRQIYLPNDWKALKDALYEEQLAALGITREYLKQVRLKLTVCLEAVPS